MVGSADSSATATAIIVAGGTGERFGRDQGKQLAVVGSRPLLAVTVDAFMQSRAVGEIVLVCDPARVGEYEQAVRTSLDVVKRFVAVKGGSTRQHSVENGLDAVGKEYTEIVVHDGARPLVQPDLIDRMLVELRMTPELDGLVVGHPSFDTLKIVDGQRVLRTPDRSEYWVAQTPQAFRTESIRRAYNEAFRLGRTATDDSSLVEAAGGSVQMNAGPRDNIKVTVPEDLGLVEAALSARGEL